MNNLGSRYMMLSGVAGLASAVLFIAMLIFPSLFIRQIAAIISPAALGMVALSMGLNAALIASAVGTILVLLAFPNAGFIYLVLDAVPVLIITYLFIRVYENKENPTNLSIGKIISIISLVCCVCMVAFLFLMPYQVAATALGIEFGSIKEFFFNTFTSQLKIPQGFDKDAYDMAMDTVASYFPSVLFLSWFFRVIIAMMIAQALIASKDKMLRATPEYAQIEIPKWAIIPLPILLLIALTGSEDVKYIGNNALMIMLTPFLCLGLAQVHLFARKLKAFAVPLLVVFYVIFFSGYAYAMLAVSLLGIFEFFINQKLIKDKISRE